MDLGEHKHPSQPFGLGCKMHTSANRIADWQQYVHKTPFGTIQIDYVASRGSKPPVDSSVCLGWSSFARSAICKRRPSGSEKASESHRKVLSSRHPSLDRPSSVTRSASCDHQAALTDWLVVVVTAQWIRWKTLPPANLHDVKCGESSRTNRRTRSCKFPQNIDHPTVSRTNCQRNVVNVGGHIGGVRSNREHYSYTYLTSPLYCLCTNPLEGRWFTRGVRLRTHREQIQGVVVIFPPFLNTSSLSLSFSRWHWKTSYKQQTFGKVFVFLKENRATLASFIENGTECMP